jgi:hypothetical protein
MFLRVPPKHASPRKVIGSERLTHESTRLAGMRFGAKIPRTGYDKSGLASPQPQRAFVKAVSGFAV